MMGARIDAIPEHTTTRERAEEIAEALQAGELDGWTYHVVPVGERWAVAVRDADGDPVGRW